MQPTFEVGPKGAHLFDMDEQFAADLLLIGVRQSDRRFDRLFQKIDQAESATFLAASSLANSRISPGASWSMRSKSRDRRLVPAST